MNDPDDYRPDDTHTHTDDVTVPWGDEEEYR